MAKQKSKNKSIKIGFWTMVRDVLIASLNKGQFPLALFGVIVMVLIVKMPSEDVTKLVFEIFDSIINLSFIGYILGGISTLGWFIHLRIQRRQFTYEIKRISEEKKRLQEKLTGRKLKSSD